jgi:hypothetical protein
VVGPFNGEVSLFLADRHTREFVLKVTGEIRAAESETAP